MAALNAVVTRVKHRMFGACDAAAALLVGTAVPMRTPPLCTHNGSTSVSQPRATQSAAAAPRTVVAALRLQRRWGSRCRTAATANSSGIAVAAITGVSSCGFCGCCCSCYRGLAAQLSHAQLPHEGLPAVKGDKTGGMSYTLCMPSPLPPFAAVNATHLTAPRIAYPIDTLELGGLPVGRPVLRSHRLAVHRSDQGNGGHWP
jgi:hypothetical protein